MLKPTLHYNNTRVPIHAHTGEKFIIVTVDRVASGAMWDLAEPLDERVVRLDGAPVDVPEFVASLIVQSRAHQYWTFTATGRGQTTIVFDRFTYEGERLPSRGSRTGPNGEYEIPKPPTFTLIVE